MSVNRFEYIHLPPGSDLPAIIPSPRRIIVLVSQRVSSEFREVVSDWIVDSGCRYMMAWGIECASWDESVDLAQLRKIGWDEEIPDDRFVMTTWHEEEPLWEVFSFARLSANHPFIEMPTLTILDITECGRESSIRALHEVERCGLLGDLPGDARDLPLLDRIKILLRMR